jgi:hypothetical protein
MVVHRKSNAQVHASTGTRVAVVLLYGRPNPAVGLPTVTGNWYCDTYIFRTDFFDTYITRCRLVSYG